MASVEALLGRARASEDGEAYAAVARGAGFRLGIGARTRSEGETALFVEVVLDPFPDRPRVDPARMKDQSDRLAKLAARGYRLACDADGTVVCDRTLSANRIPRELRQVETLLRLGGAMDEP